MNEVIGEVKFRKFGLITLGLAFLVLLLGGVFGVLQGLNRAGLLEFFFGFEYYQMLTLHGVLMIVSFTLLFMNGYLYSATDYALGGLPKLSRTLAWIGLVSFVIAAALIVTTILMGEATVMYTFYAPMAASPWFYVGLVFLAITIYSSAFGIFYATYDWKKRNKGKHLPLHAFFATGAYLLITLGTLAVTAKVLLQLFWVLEWTSGINVLLDRTLLWWFGHTLVNVWYLVAISAWYLVLPKVIGTKIFSDSLARVVVILIVVLNVPGGFHHQIVDPGFSETLKFGHLAMSLAIAVPSLFTAFAMFATLERAGRRRGGKGLLGWLVKLPWRDPKFLTIMIAMIGFIFGGAGGIAQTSNQLNQVVHNTFWVVGHFHVTVGIAAVLTFFGVAWWLVPHLARREFSPGMHRFALWQTWAWVIGMFLMSASMSIVGLMGTPRRSQHTTYGDHAHALEWNELLLVVGLGTLVLMIAGIMMVGGIYYLMFFAKKGHTPFYVQTIQERDAYKTPMWTENWAMWFVLAIVLITMAYGYPIVDMVINAPPGSPMWRTW